MKQRKQSRRQPLIGRAIHWAKSLRLINEWRRSWRMISVQCMTLSIAIQASWDRLPAELKSTFSDETMHTISISLLVLGIIGRMVLQPKLRKENETT